MSEVETTENSLGENMSQTIIDTDLEEVSHISGNTGTSCSSEKIDTNIHLDKLKPPLLLKDVKVSISKLLQKVEDAACKVVQTGTADEGEEEEVEEGDVTDDESYMSTIEYWISLAEERRKALVECQKECEKLKAQISELKDENGICKVMLNESKNLLTILHKLMDTQEAPHETTGMQ